MKIVIILLFMVSISNTLYPQNSNNEKAAVLLIEFQKSWTEKSFFYHLIKSELNSRNVIENTINVISVARDNEIMVIHAPLILDKNNKDHYNKTPFPARLLNQFTKGTWKAEFTSGMYLENDIVIVDRFGFDACLGSDLELRLSENGIKTVYICGFTTDHCVKETMKSLISKGFNCFMVFDCTATRNFKLQQQIENELPSVSSKQLINNLKGVDLY